MLRHEVVAQTNAVVRNRQRQFSPTSWDSLEANEAGPPRPKTPPKSVFVTDAQKVEDPKGLCDSLPRDQLPTRRPGGRLPSPRCRHAGRTGVGDRLRGPSARLGRRTTPVSRQGDRARQRRGVGEAIVGSGSARWRDTSSRKRNLACRDQNAGSMPSVMIGRRHGGESPHGYLCPGATIRLSTRAHARAPPNGPPYLTRGSIVITQWHEHGASRRSKRGDRRPDTGCVLAR